MVESGRQLTVFGAGYKADFECPLSIGALSGRGAALNWRQAQAIVVAESSPLPQAKGPEESCTHGLQQQYDLCFPLSSPIMHNVT